jgi:hypothetical protein
MLKTGNFSYCEDNIGRPLKGLSKALWLRRMLKEARASLFAKALMATIFLVLESFWFLTQRQ